MNIEWAWKPSGKPPKRPAKKARRRARAPKTTKVAAPPRQPPRKDKFLASSEWKRLRYQALVKHGGSCQCCGMSAADGIILNVDHIKPRSKFPGLALDLSNLQVLCASCNHGKGAWDQTDWRQW